MSIFSYLCVSLCVSEMCIYKFWVRIMMFCVCLGFSKVRRIWTKYSVLVLISIWTPNFWHLLLFRQMQMNWSLCSFFIKCLPLYLKYTSSIYFDWSFDGWNESFETFLCFWLTSSTRKLFSSRTNCILKLCIKVLTYECVY